MTTAVPTDVLLTELAPGETLEWTGRPNPSVIFHPEDWLLIPFSLLWGGFATFGLLQVSGISDLLVNRPNPRFQSFMSLWVTPFALIGQYMIWGRFVYHRWEKKRTYYALTNRRALIVHGGLRSRESSSAYFENLLVVDKRVRADGIGSISFGGPVTGEWQWGKNKPPRPPTFDDVNDVNSVYKIIVRLHDQARRSTGEPSR